MIDLIVAGAGPAGLATALYAQRAGLSVLVLDPRLALGADSEAPAESFAEIDKACGEGLMPAAVRALADLGVTTSGRPFRGIRYVSGSRQAEATFRSGYGAGVRRTQLHRALLDAAQGRPIQLEAVAAGTVRQDREAVHVNGHSARYLVAADGLHSPIRRQLGLDGPPARTKARWGLRRHYNIRPWTDLVEVHWSRRSEAYLTPITDDLVGVAVLGTDRVSWVDQLAAFPELAERLRGHEATSVRGAGQLRQRTKARVAGRVLLVGDASGYVDALTGEGIAVALACAEALVDCLVEDRPAGYERRWRAASRRYRYLTSSLLWASQQPALRRAIVPAAQHVPGGFAAVIHQIER